MKKRVILIISALVFLFVGITTGFVLSQKIIKVKADDSIVVTDTPSVPQQPQAPSAPPPAVSTGNINPVVTTDQVPQPPKAPATINKGRNTASASQTSPLPPQNNPTTQPTAIPPCK